MTFSTDAVIGIDIGTTSSKAVARSTAQPGTAYVEQRTPWHTGTCGQTEIDPSRLVDVAVELIGRAARAAESAWGPVRVRGIGVTGLGESGVLLDAAGRPAAPAIAWFDHRGAREMEQAGREFAGFAARFEGRTGLPWSTQPTIAKLLWLRNNGVPAGPASTWLNVPEWIVLGLGGDLVREPSLASRTGLIDQDTGEAWPDALAVAGLPAGILPAERLAGSPAGNLRHDGVVSCAAGAVLTVAGHDHPVAAIGVGAVEADELFNSSGTADVLTRSIPGTLDETHRQRVVSAGWSAGRHVLPDTSMILAGVNGGLLLRRVLAALGAESEQARAALDHASLSVGDLPAGLSVAGDGRTQDDVVIRIQDGASPASVWTAAVRYTAAQTLHQLQDIEKIVGPHRRAVAAGGWTQMASVRAAKAAVIDALSFSPVVQPGVTGAALLAAFALAGEGISLADFIRQSTVDPVH
ncbi:MAG TPA: FGGY family carbohydrate kinase [Streptosporangiaceae bacterium]|jgi:sugar (pentulose or hexulose) kinase